MAPYMNTGGRAQGRQLRGLLPQQLEGHAADLALPARPALQPLRALPSAGPLRGHRQRVSVAELHAKLSRRWEGGARVVGCLCVGFDYFCQARRRIKQAWRRGRAHVLHFF